MAVTTSIRATSRASVKINDSFYTVEWCEEHAISESDDIEQARKNLWDICNRECDAQIEDILKSFSKK